jgi:hypothetical protein
MHYPTIVELNPNATRAGCDGPKVSEITHEINGVIVGRVSVVEELLRMFCPCG